MKDQCPRYTLGWRVGNTIHVAGQLPYDKDGNLVGKGDIKAQTRRIFEQIKMIVADGGDRRDDEAARAPHLDVTSAEVRVLPQYSEVLCRFTSERGLGVFIDEPYARTVRAVTGLEVMHEPIPEGPSPGCTVHRPSSTRCSTTITPCAAGIPTAFRHAPAWLARPLSLPAGGWASRRTHSQMLAHPGPYCVFVQRAVGYPIRSRTARNCRSASASEIGLVGRSGSAAAGSSCA
jgi:enamine deaminase RidA (YjgF/YER057c/UK114 family)